jgi:hypothetical protein
MEKGSMDADLKEKIVTRKVSGPCQRRATVEGTWD